MTKVAAVLSVLLAGSFLTGCNTTKGMGEDVEATGEAVQDAAQKTEDKLENR